MDKLVENTLKTSKATHQAGKLTSLVSDCFSYSFAQQMNLSSQLFMVFKYFD